VVLPDPWDVPVVGMRDDDETLSTISTTNTATSSTLLQARRSKRKMKKPSKTINAYAMENARGFYRKVVKRWQCTTFKRNMQVCEQRWFGNPWSRVMFEDAKSNEDFLRSFLEDSKSTSTPSYASERIQEFFGCGTPDGEFSGNRPRLVTSSRARLDDREYGTGAARTHSSWLTSEQLRQRLTEPVKNQTYHNDFC